MKALLIKDIYTLLRQMKLFFVLVVILAVVPGFSSSGFAIVYAALMPLTALAYDERAKWDKLAVMMPYKPENMVVSKYLLGYISIAAACLLCLVAKYAVSVFTGTAVDSTALFAELIAVVAVALLLMALNLPLVLKMGVEKGRMLFLVLTVAIVIAGVSYSERYLTELTDMGRNVSQIATVMLLAALALSLISMLFSIKLYKSKAE